ncbi:MAG: hypothetical protein ALAOOOJD_01896 [bacterium]|nr:hypothetical protein [bacterium]
MKRCTIFLVVTLVLGASSFSMAQEKEKEKKGKLGEFAGDYEKNSDKKDEEKNSDGGGWLNLLVNIVLSPDEENNAAGEPRESSPPKPAPFPYRDDRGLPLRTADYRDFSVTAEAGYLRLADGLNGFQLASDIRGHRLAASLDVHALVEDLGRRNETLTFFGLNAGYEVISTPSLLAQPYVGARNLSYLSVNGWGNEFWGPEVGARLLMLPRKPINIETNFSYARLNGKPLTMASGTLGVMINRVELRLGGQMFRSDWTTLEGLRLGFRLWL